MNISKIKELPKCEAGEFYKYPRTMFEAFPTHVNTELHIQYESMQKKDIAFVYILTTITVCLIISIWQGWL